MPESTEANDCPAFTAISFDGEMIDADDNLDDLLEALDAAIDGRHGQEELAIWQRGERIVAVVKADGRIVRLDAPETHQATQEAPSPARRPRRRP